MEHRVGGQRAADRHAPGRQPATSGRIIRSSSQPIAPPSPACGFSPATAMRGAARPKSRTSPAWVMRIVSSSSAAVSAAGTSDSGIWIVAGTTRRPGQASIITTRHPGQMGQNSVWPGKAKPAPSFSAFLWMGSGDQRRGLSGLHQRHGAFDGGDDAGGIGGVGLAGRGGGGKALRQHRQAVGRTTAQPRPIDLGHGGAGGQVARIADPDEGQGGAQQGAGLDGDLGPDAGRIAAGQDDGRGSRFADEGRGLEFGQIALRQAVQLLVAHLLQHLVAGRGFGG
jgi:hypothetical protein